MDEVKCLCAAGGSSSEKIIIALLQRIAEALEGSAVGGSAQLSHGNGAPVAAPADPTAAAIYYDDDSGSPSYGNSWVWDVNLQTWI